MSIDFVTANDAEIKNLKKIDDLFNLQDIYGIHAPGAHDFQAINSISQSFFQDESQVPNEIVFELDWEFENKPLKIIFYKLNAEFVTKIASFENDDVVWELDRVWKDSNYWKSRGGGGFGASNCLFGLRNLCQYAVRDNKNVYLLEEIDESKLEK